MRLDKYLVEKKYFSSRARAKEAIECGEVLVNNKIVHAPDQEVSVGVTIEVKNSFPWVSRGALKLLAALDTFHIDPAGLTVLDIGASTGGFTEVLLSRGAKLVYAVDVGHEQMNKKLKSDPRVVSMEGVDVRSLTLKDFPEGVGLVVGDLSFISLSKVFPVIKTLVPKGASIVLLVKPQFEVGIGGTKKGIVRDTEKQAKALTNVISDALSFGFRLEGQRESPVAGGSGNREYLIHLSVLA